MRLQGGWAWGECHPYSQAGGKKMDFSEWLLTAMSQVVRGLR